MARVADNQDWLERWMAYKQKGFENKEENFLNEDTAQPEIIAG